MMAAAVTFPKLIVFDRRRYWSRSNGQVRKLSPGFRIALQTEPDQALFVFQTRRGDVVFRRRIDCQMAIDALKKAGLDTPQALLAAGIDRARQVALEGLQW